MVDYKKYLKYKSKYLKLKGGMNWSEANRPGWRAYSLFDRYHDRLPGGPAGVRKVGSGGGRERSHAGADHV